MFASMATLGVDGRFKWENIPIVKCETQDWWPKMKDNHVVEWADIHFCLDLSKGFNIYNGTNLGSARFMVDIYSCQPGGPKPCNIKMNTNDMIISTWVYEKTANYQDYQNPISQSTREINTICPSAMLRYVRTYKLGWTDIVTDKGFLTSDLEHKKMITVFDTSQTTSEKSLSNIPRNYLSQGRLFYSDLDIHLEFYTTNDKIEIYRKYFSIIDLFSALGGYLQI
jgi:hypothetical protein